MSLENTLNLIQEITKPTNLGRKTLAHIGGDLAHFRFKKAALVANRYIKNRNLEKEKDKEYDGGSIMGSAPITPAQHRHAARAYQTSKNLNRKADIHAQVHDIIKDDLNRPAPNDIRGSSNFITNTIANKKDKDFLSAVSDKTEADAYRLIGNADESNRHKQKIFNQYGLK